MADPLHKHTLNLRAGDWDYIESIYRARGIPTALVVRKIVSTFVDRLRAKEAPIDFSTISDQDEGTTL